MRILMILLTCLACADAFAQARHRSSGPPPREDDAPRRVESHQDRRPARDADALRERRESLRAFRDEMRQQQQEMQRRDVRDDRADSYYRGARTGDEDSHNLRRLSPEDRQRMRQEMRDAFRR